MQPASVFLLTIVKIRLLAMRPLFERMGAADELQKCRQVIEALQSRVQDLERINMDLESRLEDQAKQCMAVEKECIAIERSWREKAEGLENEIKDWKKKNDTQENKPIGFESI